MAHHLTFPAVRQRATAVDSFLPAALWRLLIRLFQWLCAIRGHRMVLHFERDRLSMACLSCGARTPGWSLDVRPQFQTPRPRSVAHPVPFTSVPITQGRRAA